MSSNTALNPFSNRQRKNAAVTTDVNALWTQLYNQAKAIDTLLTIKLDEALKLEQQENEEAGVSGSEYIAKASILFHVARQPLANPNLRAIATMRNSLIIALTVAFALSLDDNYMAEHEQNLASVLHGA